MDKRDGSHSRRDAFDLRKTRASVFGGLAGKNDRMHLKAAADYFNIDSIYN